MARLTVVLAPDANCLLITSTVSAASGERTAANVETLSGFGPAALTLVSPKPDLLPS